MAAAANDDDIIFRFGFGFSPNRLPAFVAGQTFFENLETRIFHLQPIVCVGRIIDSLSRIDFPQIDVILQIMDKSRSSTVPFRVGIYPVPGFALMSYACTVEPLRAANLLSEKQLYEIVHFDEGHGVQSSGTARVDGQFKIGDHPPLDMVLVVAGGDPEIFRQEKAASWLRGYERRGTMIGGVSAGPYILARAGLMKGRRMTVHWQHAGALEELDPSLMLERRLYVIDRDRVTCGGGTAPLDLMHALIAEHHGAEFARLVSDWFLHTGIRGATEPQRGGLSARLGTTSGAILDAAAAMEDHIADPLTLVQLADRAGVTSRQLNRLFKEKLGQTTMTYYRRLRVLTGRRLIEDSPMSVTEVAMATGFANSAHFSRAFSDLFGRPPSQFRR